MKKYKFKKYSSDREVTALLYDGTEECRDFIIAYGRFNKAFNSKGKLKVNTNTCSHFVRRNSRIEVPADYYVVIYPTGAWYPYNKKTFEARFITKTRVKNERGVFVNVKKTKRISLTELIKLND